MIIGIGCDVVNMERLNKTSEFLERFGKRILGKDELQEFLDNKPFDKDKVIARLAKLYAAKEAFSKALGTGFRDGIFLSDIQILHDKNG
jgi:holo-[acyl-carrier protein] synthase